MKKVKSLFLLVSIVPLLTACGCGYESDDDLSIELYRECIQLLSESHRGAPYTTDDDEDYDEAIRECRDSAVMITRKWVCESDTELEPERGKGQ